jgi:hypothetical protein
MLKIYDKLEDVPEALRGEYKLVGGKYVPDLSDDHPVLVNNKTLLNEKNAVDAKVSGLETANANLKADVESAKASGLPRGHVAVTKAEAEAITAFKEHGTPTEITAKLTEHKTLKEESATRARQDNLRAVAKELGYTNVEAFVRLPGLPDFEIREKDGKKTVIAKVKGEGDVITEKPAQEFIEGSADLAPFLPALKTQEGIRAPVDGKDSGKPAGNLYDQIRDNVKKTEEAATKANTIPLGQRRGITEIGGAQQV